MRLSIVAVAVLLFSAPLALGQQNESRSAQQTAGTQTSATRSSYDPMTRTGGKSQPKGMVETALAGVNPQNRDYGSLIGEWRKEVFEMTVNRVYLWLIVGLCIALGTSLLANSWLLRQRQRRLAITAKIVVQLFNAYIASRAKTLETIGRYNSLVERHNRLAVAPDTRTPELEGQNDGKVEARVDFDRAKKDKDSFQAKATLAPASTNDGENHNQKYDLSNDDLRSRLAEYETKLQRKDAQLQAKDNQITNLRGRLTRAHDTLEGERQQNTVAK